MVKYGMHRVHGYFTIGRCTDCGSPCLVYVTKVDSQGNEYGNSLFCFDRSEDAEGVLGMFNEQLQGIFKRYKLLEKEEIPKVFKEAFNEDT